MAKCEYCGARIIRKNIDHCPSCGSPLPDTVVEQVIKHEVHIIHDKPSVEYTDKSRPLPLAARIILGISLFVVVGAVILLAIDSPNGSKTTELTADQAALRIPGYIDAISKNPNDTQSRLSLIEAYIITKKDDMAEEQINSMVMMDSKNPTTYSKLYDVCKKNKRDVFAADVLRWGCAMTNSDELKKIMKDTIQPLNAIRTDEMKEIIRQMFGKSASDITWEDLESIKYLDVSTTGIDFSLEDSTAAADEAVFAKTIQHIPVDKISTVVKDYTIFMNLTELRFANNIGVKAQKLQSLPKLKRLKLSCSNDSKDLKEFAVFGELEALSVHGESLKSLDGIENIKNLKKIELRGTSISNLSALSSAKTLQSVTLSDNEQLKGLDTMSGVSGLRELRIEGDTLSNLNLVAKFGSLESLAIEDTIIKDIAFLSSLKNLKKLSFVDNDKATDVSVIGNLKSLEELTVDMRYVKTAFTFNNLKGIRKLRLSGGSKLPAGITELTELEELYLPGCGGIDTLTGMSKLSKLKILDLSNHSYSQFNAAQLAGLKNLKSLNLSKTEFYAEISSIAKLTSLEELNLSESQLNLDVNALTALTSLKMLDVSKSRLVYNVKVETDGFISNVYYDKREWNNVLATLGKISSLEKLVMAKNEIASLDFVKGLSNLKYLDVQDNTITDASPLASLKGLRYVDLTANPVRDWAFAENLPNTRITGR